MTNARPAGPLAVVQAVYSALQDGDVAALLALLDPGFTARLTPGLPWGLGRGPIQGAEAMVRDGWGVVARKFDIVAVPEEYFPMDDVVVVQGAYRGASRANRRPLEARFVHIWRVRGARVVGLHQVTDTAAWWESLRGPGQD